MDLDKFSIIHQVLAANDIVDVVSEYVNIKRRGRNYMGLCPFHHEKTASFSVSPEKQIFKCFGCGAGGDVIKFIQRMQNLDFWEAVEVLAERAKIKLPQRRSAKGREKHSPKTEIYKVNRWAADLYHKILIKSPYASIARKYIQSRRISLDACKEFLIGYAPDEKSLIENSRSANIPLKLLQDAGLIRADRDMFRERIIFPITDVLGNIVGFGARTIKDEEPKYLNTPETIVFSKQRQLFGLYQAKEAIKQLNKAIIVEGYTDVISAHQAGIKNVIATLGTALTEQHVSILRRYTDNIVLVFDADQAGQNAANRAIEIFLTMGVDVKIATIPEGKDPDEYINEKGREAFEKLIDDAKDSLQYKWETLKHTLQDKTSPSQKKEVVDEFIRLLATVNHEKELSLIHKGMFITRLSELLNIPSEEIHYQLRNYNRRAKPGITNEPSQKDELDSLLIPNDPEEAAYRDILEVLLCEPGYISAIPEDIRPADFKPEYYRIIAEKLWQMYEGIGEDISLAELISLVEDEKIANLAIVLQREGQRKGNFYNTLMDAISSLQRCRKNQQVSSLFERLNTESDPQKIEQYLKSIHNILLSHKS